MDPSEIFKGMRERGAGEFCRKFGAYMLQPAALISLKGCF